MVYGQSGPACATNFFTAAACLREKMERIRLEASFREQAGGDSKRTPRASSAPSPGQTIHFLQDSHKDGIHNQSTTFSQLLSLHIYILQRDFVLLKLLSRSLPITYYYSCRSIDLLSLISVLVNALMGHETRIAGQDHNHKG